jgi:Zn-dependent M28 family amino/carboxypeptidase
VLAAGCIGWRRQATPPTPEQQRSSSSTTNPASFCRRARSGSEPRQHSPASASPKKLEAGSGSGRNARIAVDASTDPGESQNVRATLGPDTDSVLLLAHYDAHDLGEGALDNGCGVAVLLGVVRALATLELDCRVDVAAVGCEEIGLLGSQSLAKAEGTDDIRAVVNIDGAGRFRDLRAYTHASGSLRTLVEEVGDQTAQPVGVVETPHAYSDHWPFLRRGVPAIQLHSAPADTDGSWTRGWTHTAGDTRDKVDVRNVREHAMLATALVVKLTRTAVSVDVETVRAQLETAGAEPGMRAAGVWPGEWD